MIAAWCFQCGLDYTDEVGECVECGVPTVAHPPGSLDDVAADGGAQVAYELHGWNANARAEVERELWKARLVHAWQGPTMIVREADEDAVDDIIGAIDERMATSASDAVEAEEGQVGFDLGMRNTALQEGVVARLGELGIGHELLGNGFLLVEAADEDTVGDVIESVQDSLGTSERFGDGVEGVDAHQVIESLFLAADALRRNPRDERSRRELIDAEALARRLPLPFGYDAAMWRSVLDRCGTLAGQVADTVATDEAVEQEAGLLRAMLHPYV